MIHRMTRNYIVTAAGEEILLEETRNSTVAPRRYIGAATGEEILLHEPRTYGLPAEPWQNAVLPVGYDTEEIDLDYLEETEEIDPDEEEL